MDKLKKKSQQFGLLFFFVTYSDTRDTVGTHKTVLYQVRSDACKPGQQTMFLKQRKTLHTHHHSHLLSLSGPDCHLPCTDHGSYRWSHPRGKHGLRCCCSSPRHRRPFLSQGNRDAELGGGGATFKCRAGVQGGGEERNPAGRPGRGWQLRIFQLYHKLFIGHCR